METSIIRNGHWAKFMLKLPFFDQRELGQSQVTLSALKATMIQFINRKSNTPTLPLVENVFMTSYNSQQCLQHQ